MSLCQTGGATLHGDSGEQQSELFEAADAELYRAKQAGRNRIAWRERVTLQT